MTYSLKQQAHISLDRRVFLMLACDLWLHHAADR